MDDLSLTSERMTGRLRTALTDRRSVSFAFGGDTAGQRHQPRLGHAEIIHSGDVIYVDGPLKPEVELPDGTIRKIVTIALGLD